MATRTITAMGTERKMGKITALYFTVLDRDSSFAEGKTYKIKDVVADTTGLDQEDNAVETIESEFDDAPLFESITNGKITAVFEAGSIPNELLTEIFGYEIDATSNNIYAPAAYKEVWGKFEFVFSSSPDSIVLPKVKLSGKLSGASLKKGLLRGKVSGTVYPIEKTINGVEKQTPLYIEKDGAKKTDTAATEG